MKPKELITILEANGWQRIRTRGSHYMYKHPNNPTLLTIPFHNQDMKLGTLNQILKAAGLK